MIYLQQPQKWESWANNVLEIVPQIVRIHTFETSDTVSVACWLLAGGVNKSLEVKGKSDVSSLDILSKCVRVPTVDNLIDG